MHGYHLPITLLLFLLLPITAWANERDYFQSGNWRLETDRQGISVYFSNVADSGVKAFKALTTIDASMASVFAVIYDAKACDKWVYECTQGKILNNGNFSEKFVYILNELPWPARTRDYILRVRTASHDSGNRIVIHARSEPAMLPEKDPEKYVRIRKIFIHYELEKLSDTRTKITWMQHTEPSGNIPDWMTNMNLDEIPMYSLNKLKDLVRQPPYSKARFRTGTDWEIEDIEY